MNEVATFFRNPSGDAGVTYQFQIGTERGQHQFFVYARRRVNAFNFSDQELKHRDLSLFQKDVATTLRGQGGGMVVVASGEGTWRNVEISTVASGGYLPANRYTVLRPGYPSHSLAIDAPAKIALGSHLLVPVDRDAEEQLQTVLSLLSWFSPDFEALVSNAIRRPSLDVRLAKLENRLLGETADAANAEAGMTRWTRFRRRCRRLCTNPALYGWGAAALLLALLGLNAYFLRRVESKLPATRAVTTNKGPITATKANVLTPPVSKPALASRTKELLAEVRARSSRHERLKLLYDAHFAPFDREAVDDAHARQWFSRQTSNNGSRPLLLGMIKLQILALQPNVADTRFLTAWDEITATKKVLRGIDDYRSHETALRLMSVLSCRLGYDSSGAPQLPAFANSPALVLMPDGRCDALGDEEIEQGLAQLLDYVRTL